jgi:hypothetical protein
VVRVEEKQPDLDDPSVVAHAQWPAAHEDDVTALTEGQSSALGSITQQLLENSYADAFRFGLDHPEAET